MAAPGGGDDSNWGGPPPPSGGRPAGGDPNETRLGYQLSTFSQLTNQRIEELTRQMREGFAAINTTIGSQQYVTRERYDGDRRADKAEIDALREVQKEQRGTISRLWWLLAGTVVAAIVAALVNAAIVRGGP